MINTMKMLEKQRRAMKGQNLSIKTMAVMILGIMIVVLVYGAFSGWFDTVVSEFTGSMTYPDPSS